MNRPIKRFLLFFACTATGMSLSAASIRQIWHATNGNDPIFAPIDGMNCPNLPTGDPASHSLLLERGLFRIALPWPPVDDALKTQAQSAAYSHMEVEKPLSREQLERIRELELQLYAAQAFSNGAGRLDERGVPSGLGPRAMEHGDDGVLGNNTTRFVIPMEEKWP